MFPGLINSPNMISMQSNTLSNAMNIPQPVNEPTPVIAPINVPKCPIILSTLTDDMFIVETPSFNVPFVYEKFPKKSLKEFIDNTVKIKNIKRNENENQYEEFLDKKGENNQKKKCSTKLDTYEKMDINESENKVSCYKKKLDGRKQFNDEQMLLDKSEMSKKIDSKSENLSEIIDLKEIYSTTNLTVDCDKNKTDVKPKIQTSNYFESPLGKFFMQIGLDLVQEHVQLDLSRLHTQRKKNDHKSNKYPKEVQMSNNSLIKTLDISQKNNDLLQSGLKMCELCDFKSESSLVIARHLDISHVTANTWYKCNICAFMVNSPYEILQHMDTHNIKTCLETGPVLHQCPNCPFEIDNKGKFNRHLAFCSKRYQPKINQAPLLDWEPPAKIPRVLQNKPSMNSRFKRSVHQAVFKRYKQLYNIDFQQLQQQKSNKIVSDDRACGRSILPRQQFPRMVPSQIILPKLTSEGILFKNNGIESTNQPNIIPTPYLINTNAHQVIASTTLQPLTFPLNSTQSAHVSTISNFKPHHIQLPSISTNNNNKPVKCEICDYCVTGLEKLHKHMQFMHKVKIHPKLIYSQPPIKCPKCLLTFFSDKGLEKHLLRSHGFVTYCLSKAADNQKDGGRCPVCDKHFSSALLNHISRDHSIFYNIIYLTYKCTDCTSKFNTFENFESHVLSEHRNINDNSNKKPLGN